MCVFKQDVRLVFDNAMLFNPPGHFIHAQAQSLLKDFNHYMTTLVNEHGGVSAEPSTASVPVESQGLLPLITEQQPVETPRRGTPTHQLSCTGGSGSNFTPGIAMSADEMDTPHRHQTPHDIRAIHSHIPLSGGSRGNPTTPHVCRLVRAFVRLLI